MEQRQDLTTVAGRSETRQCQSCQTQFVIEPEDFAFYQKMNVPAPTWCPDCRMQRRMIWRNERSLYNATCAATGKPVLTMFSPQSNVIVYDHDYWWSDAWDQLESGREYDFTRPFFEQYKELLARAPLPNLANTNVTNCDYANHIADCKDCYLLYASYECENVNYSRGAVGCRDSMDVYIADKSENCYDSSFLGHNYNVAYSFDLDDCSDCLFIQQSKKLDECLGCTNLQHKQYHLWNRPHSKEEYRQKLAAYNLGSYQALEKFREEYQGFIQRYPRRYATIISSENCTGDMIQFAKNVQFGFDVFGEVEDCKYLAHAVSLKDSYDCAGAGAGAELLYEGVDSGINGYRYAFTVYTHHCREVSYTYACQNSQNLFGCVGLNHKQYCILNKQYTKEEYEALLPKIRQQMLEMPYVDAKGRSYGFGEFFPPEISPFAYNESVAQEYYPLDRAAIETKGFRWREPEPSHHPITLKATDLPDHIRDVDDSILKETIECQHQQTCQEQCTQAFRIQPKELAFLIQHNYPLPRLCPNCRHHQRIKRRNPLKLWNRPCTCAGAASENGIHTNVVEHFHRGEHCPNEFETTYAPDRPEIVYCEPCYQAEVV